MTDIDRNFNNTIEAYYSSPLDAVNLEPDNVYHFYNENAGDFTTVCDSCGCPEFSIDMDGELACIQCEETIGFAERIREEY